VINFYWVNNMKFNEKILELRKKKGYTQQELASKLNVTDKAVSKWERGLSYPDITSLSQLAKALDVETQELIDLCQKNNKETDESKLQELVNLIIKSVSIAMAIAVVVLGFLDQLVIKDAIIMLGIGLLCINISFFKEHK